MKTEFIYKPGSVAIIKRNLKGFYQEALNRLDETAPVRIKGDAEIIHIDETVTALLFTKEVTIEYLNERGEVERQEIFYKITSRKPKGLTLRMNASELPARR